jgi:tRNA-modifying protein YgfZ
VVAVESGPDTGRPWHYGDPLREQRTYVSGQGVVDLSHRGVLTITGADRLGWLHSLTSQDLDHLQPYVSAEALVLSPHGHVEHALHVIDDGDTTWITVEPGTAPALTAWLDSMRFLLRVDVADATADWAVVGEPSRTPSGPGHPVAWVDPWPAVSPGSVAYGPVDAHPGAAWTHREVLVPRGDLTARLSADAHVGLWALEALRAEAARPRLGLETDHRTIPHELDWLRTAVHLEKGCYRGQETVARVHNLGRPPRRLVLLHLDGSEAALPSHDDPVTLEGRQVGRITSSGRWRWPSSSARSRSRPPSTRAGWPPPNRSSSTPDGCSCRARPRVRTPSARLPGNKLRRWCGFSAERPHQRRSLSCSP